jgi:hypothetical protein
MWRSTTLLLAVGLVSACDFFTQECTAIGCVDGTDITLGMPDNNWPAGSYELAFTIDGDAHSCAMVVPDEALGEPGGGVGLSCEPQVGEQHRLGRHFEAWLIPMAECTEQPTADAVSQSSAQTQTPNTHCEPIHGAWLLTASFYGVAESLRVTVQRDGSTLLDRTLQPEYKESGPNGPDCEPTCLQANVELMVE